MHVYGTNVCIYTNQWRTRQDEKVRVGVLRIPVFSKDTSAQVLDLVESVRSEKVPSPSARPSEKGKLARGRSLSGDSARPIATCSVLYRLRSPPTAPTP